MGVWIEILIPSKKPSRQPSLPAWECGLKCTKVVPELDAYRVTPCVGVWIEIECIRRMNPETPVTPCVGVWIEIDGDGTDALIYSVTPCVGVWIEIPVQQYRQITGLVTPCVGVWIEISIIFKLGFAVLRHSLRGSVD